MAAPTPYLLHLADNALVLGQRNAEWCGHGPVLEEDIAMANISLDLIGQARLLYQHAADLLRHEADADAVGACARISEDSLAYLRDPDEFLNFTLLELPHFASATGPLAPGARDGRDYATTIVRNVLYDALMLELWEKLQQSSDLQLAAIAAKSLKEIRYHWRHSRDWLVRFGDGTRQSHARVQAALQHLMPYTLEFWSGSPFESDAVACGAGVSALTLKPAWDRSIQLALDEATLELPGAGSFVFQGKSGQHSEHLSYLLDEMQSLARRHPGAAW